MDKRVDRELESRDEFQRPDSWKPASLLPEFKKVPGWAYRWIRTSLLNDADNLNVSSKMREGWEPVKLADHPEMKIMVDQNSVSKTVLKLVDYYYARFQKSSLHNVRLTMKINQNSKPMQLTTAL
jgi:hypothetical protein